VFGEREEEQERKRMATERNLAFSAAVVAALLYSVPAMAQTPMNCQDSVAQDPTKVFRGGLWKQWFYWAVPGPAAFTTVQRIVEEVNVSRRAAQLPTLIARPFYEVIVSVFDERNARGANGSSAFPETSNHEAFLASFVDDSAGGSEVLFLTDPIRSNTTLTTQKSVPGVQADVERAVESKLEKGVENTHIEWHLTSVLNDEIRFSAHYSSTSVSFRTVEPAARVDYANCDLTHGIDIIYRSAPTRTYPLFSRDEGNWFDLSQPGARVRVQVKHHDSEINTIFNDPSNIPEFLIGTDRDVRIESR
jgi:hypothetical protein